MTGIVRVFLLLGLVQALTGTSLPRHSDVTRQAVLYHTLETYMYMYTFSVSSAYMSM